MLKPAFYLYAAGTIGIVGFYGFGGPDPAELRAALPFHEGGSVVFGQAEGGGGAVSINCAGSHTAAVFRGTPIMAPPAAISTTGTPCLGTNVPG
jgi:hypothetical protein